MSYRNDIKPYFETADKPTQSQFYETFDKIWFKDEKLDITDITNLAKILNDFSQAILDASHAAGFKKISSADFTDATHYNNILLPGRELAIFWNDLPKYLDEGVDYDITLTGINITVPGFDATANNYKFIIHHKLP